MHLLNRPELITHLTCLAAPSAEPNGFGVMHVPLGYLHSPNALYYVIHPLLLFIS